MGVTTWLDRITDESNLWLSACKAEEAKEFPSAAVQYLTDATLCLKRGSKVRAALSCFCAADCVTEMGTIDEARRLYFASGRLYSAMADHGASGSIREALWALQRAYASYVLAGQVKESEATFDAFKLLARRANPFSSGSQWLEMPKVAPRHPGKASNPVSGLPPDLQRAVDAFLSLSTEPGPATGGIPLPSRRVGGMVDDQESIVSQLG